jgi:hypothetical protein
MNATTAIERLKGLAVVVMCLTVAAAAGKSLLPAGAPPEYPDEMPPPPYAAGEAIQPIKDLEGNRRTLLMVVSPNCRFCTKSMPFYQRLLADRSSRRYEARIVALYLPIDNEESVRAYMQSHGVQPDQVLPFPREVLGRLSGTPSLVLMDSANTVLGSWRGMLNKKGEEEVLKAIGS